MKPDRIPPQNAEAERSTLGAMLLNPDALPRVFGVIGNIGPKVFYEAKHQKIYAAICRLEETRKPIDEVTLYDQLKEDGEIEGVGGVAYTSTLTQAVPTSANAEYYAAIVRDAWRARETMRLGTLLHDTAAQNDDDTAMSMLTDQLVALRAVDAGPQTTRIGDSAQAVAENLRAISEGRISGGYRTGWHDLDYLLSGGLHDSLLYVVCGRQGQGKTTLAFNIAYNIARTNQAAVLFFSLEMGREQIVEKLFQLAAGVNVTAIRNRTAMNYELGKLDSTVREVQTLEIHIDDHPQRGVNHLRARTSEFKREHSRSLVIIDYLQLMSGDPKAKSREIQVAEISRAVKNLSVELSMPVIMLSQLNRESEQIADLHEKFNHQRESGAIEQDADVGIVISRPTDQDRKAAEKAGRPLSEDLIYICVAKHRTGPVGIRQFLFDKLRQRFSPVDDQKHDPPAQWAGSLCGEERQERMF